MFFGYDRTVSKDPKDYKKTEHSTDWSVDRYYCKKCKKSNGTQELMSGVCTGCGSFKTMQGIGRSYRKIYTNGAWKYQVRYESGEEEIVDEWY